MKTIEILRENEPTSDGRMLVGPVELPEGPLPIRKPEPVDGYVEYVEVGSAVNFRRKMNRVYCDVPDYVEALAVEITLDPTKTKIIKAAEGKWTMSSGTSLLGAVVIPKSKYLWRSL